MSICHEKGGQSSWKLSDLERISIKLFVISQACTFHYHLHHSGAESERPASEMMLVIREIGASSDRWP